MNQDATKTSLGARRILSDGTVLANRYTISKLLGVGGMGMVYLARDNQLEIDVALKVLRPGGDAGETRLERFRRELVLARQISHRNVVRIHDIGQSADLYFITMDYVEGESLKQVLDQSGAIDADRAVSIAADLAEALAEAHRTDVVHRDVKPANVMIGTDRAYLTDFGIARSIQSDGLTRAGDVIGTLDYLSPEQARGEAVDGRADVYALGLLLYEMLTGERPFSGETAEEVLAQRLLSSPRHLATSDTIPAKLRGILSRCLAVNPADRYQDAAELAADLRAGHTSRWPTRPTRGRAIAWIAGVASVAVALVIAARFLWLEPGAARGPQHAMASPAPSLAVLPFAVSIAGGDLDSLAHGLSQVLTENLAAGGDVRLVPHERVGSTLDDLSLSPHQLPDSERSLLADLLDADYIVLGRLQQVGDSYHVEARLQAGATGDVLHRTSFDVEAASSVFSTIEPMAAELRSRLDLLSPEGSSTLLVTDPVALSAFSNGVEQLSRGNALAAVDPLRAAVQAAPEFALAWDRLAQTLATLGRDSDALAAADAAVEALAGSGGRSGAIVRARRSALAGRPDEAIAELEAQQASTPGDIDVLFMLAEIYGDAGRLEEAIQALQQVVGTSPDHPQAWYLLGKFSILQGNARQAADDYLVKALVVQNRLNNPQGRADALNAMGIARAQLGDAESASNYYQQALRLREEIGDERGVAAALANLARISLREGRYDEAKQDLEAARDRLADIGDRWTIANLENELGYLEETRGQFTAALSHYREALRIRDTLGDLRALAESYNNIGYTYYVLGEYDNAALFIERSLETYSRTGNREGLMHANQTNGILNAARGRYDDALRALLTSLQISREINDAHAEAVTEGYMAVARFLQGQYAAAQSTFASVREELEAMGDERGLAEFTLRHAEMLLELGMHADALAAIDKAAELLANDSNASANAMLLRMQGEHLLQTGNGQSAAEKLAAALHEARSSGERVAILLARLSVARTLNLESRIAELQDVRGESVRLGHQQLAVDASVALGKALSSAGRHAEAQQVLQDIADGAYTRQPFNGDYKMFAALADVRASQQIDAVDSWERAANSVQRALEAQTPDQQASFRQLATVQYIADRAGTSP